jgi:hypothetical protein
MHTLIYNCPSIDSNKLDLSKSMKDVHDKAEKKIFVNDILKHYDLEETKFNNPIQFFRGKTIHFSQTNLYNINIETKNKYYINLDLIEEVVGEDCYDQEGFLLELLAYSFFDKGVKIAIKKKTEELMRESAGLFYTPNYKTLLEDKILKDQMERYKDVL